MFNLYTTFLLKKVSNLTNYNFNYNAQEMQRLRRFFFSNTFSVSQDAPNCSHRTLKDTNFSLSGTLNDNFSKKFLKKNLQQ